MFALLAAHWVSDLAFAEHIALKINLYLIFLHELLVVIDADRVLAGEQLTNDVIDLLVGDEKDSEKVEFGHVLFSALLIGAQDYLQRNGLLPVFRKLWEGDLGVPCGFEEIAVAAGEIKHPLILFARPPIDLEESYLAF